MSSQTLPRPRKATPKRRRKAASRGFTWWPLFAAVAVTFFTVKTAEILPLMGADGLLKLQLLYPYALLLKQPLLATAEPASNQWSQIMLYAQFPVYGLYATIAANWKPLWKVLLHVAMFHLLGFFHTVAVGASVKIVECPRDAWQSLPHPIPAASKAAYLSALMAAGFQHIDAAAFVSPDAVPQMADSEEVLALLAPVPNVEIIGIVVNQRGAERAIRTAAVHTLGFPYSVSATFLERNQKQTALQARQTLESICRQAFAAGLGVVAYVSMAFGNPYGDPWSSEDVIAACHILRSMGIQQISLADTVGIATPDQIQSLLTAVLTEMPDVEVGAHLHARPQQAAEKIAAACRAGCRRLDMALGGLGGCPFAQDALVGNVATETALAELRRLGADLPAWVRSMHC